MGSTRLSDSGLPQSGGRRSPQQHWEMDCGVMDCVSVYGWVRIKMATHCTWEELNGPCLTEIKHGNPRQDEHDLAQWWGLGLFLNLTGITMLWASGKEHSPHFFLIIWISLQSAFIIIRDGITWNHPSKYVFILPSSILHQCWISIGVERNEALWGIVIGRRVFNMFYDKQLRIDDSNNYRHKIHIGYFFILFVWFSGMENCHLISEGLYLNLQSAYKTWI